MYAFLFQALMFATLLFTPIVSLIFLVAIDTFLPTVPVVTFSPIGVQIGGEGIRLTRIVIAAAVVKIGERLWVLNSKEWPEAVPLGENDTHDKN